MTTRRVHVVRIKDASGNNFVDVKVLDAIAFRGPSGAESLLDCSATNVSPYIKDTTGDGNGKGDPSDCTRVSHMKRLTNPNDSTQFIDVEILDAASFRGPNGAEMLLFMPDADATELVVDNTGNGLDNDSGADATRALHVVRITQDTDDNPHTTVNDASDDQFLLVKRLDAVAFRGPNGAENLLYAPASDGDDNEDDTTTYNGDGSPPDNTDPNVYAAWPTLTSSSGPWLGAGAPVSQGLLWWIMNAGALGGAELVLVAVTIGGVGVGQIASITGLPCVPAAMPMTSGAVLTDGASGAPGSGDITSLPSAAMLAHAYAWGTPYQHLQEFPGDETTGYLPNFVAINYALVNMSALMRDFPDWDKSFSVQVPSVTGTPITDGSYTYWIVWYQLDDTQTSPFVASTISGELPPWVAVFYDDDYPQIDALPIYTNNQILAIVEGAINPAGGSTPVLCQGGEAAAESFVNFYEPILEEIVFASSVEITEDTGGQLAQWDLAVGLFNSAYGASGASGGSGASNPNTKQDFNQTYLTGTDEGPWYLASLQNLEPPLGPGPISYADTGFFTSIGNTGGVSETITVGATGASGASGASGLDNVISIGGPAAATGHPGATGV
jgi:hypothetical protein